MSQPISRRSAILRMFAAFNTAKLLAWEAPRDGKLNWSAEPAKIVPGERFGDLFLEMRKSEVVSQFGLPCETLNFEAEDLEEQIKLYAYLNEKTGSNLSIDANPPRPAMTYFNYDHLGLSICLVEDRVFNITGYTGVLSGYVNDHKSHFPVDRIPSGAASLRTLNDVRIYFGKPESEISNEYAPIPECNLFYSHGITFNGRTDDGRLSTIIVSKRKAS